MENKIFKITTRKIDELGRIVLPIELRQELNFCAGDDIDILREENCIILNKHSSE